MSTAALPQDDVCPNCGHLAQLVDTTGWCPQCTLEHDPETLVCSCGAVYPKSAQVSKCWACRKEEWLSKHADQIEELLAQGLTVAQAVKRIADRIRPTCHCCGKEIRGGRASAKFCRKNAKCEKAAKTFTTLKRTGLSPDVALAIASGKVAVIR